MYYIDGTRYDQVDRTGPVVTFNGSTRKTGLALYPGMS